MPTVTIAPGSSTAQLLTFSPRSVLSKSSQLWVIQSGFVRVMTSSEEGGSLTLGLWGSGDVVGSAISAVRPFSIECLTQVQATPMSVDQYPDLTGVLLKHLHQSEALMLIRSHKRIDVMLLKLLSWLADRFGQDAHQGRLIDLRLTHQDLSELLGATRVTVTRALIQLEQQGFIQRLSLQRIVLQQVEYWHYQI